jgi:dTDP-4-amino-4,6-dideoxygalactose transaminase
LLNFLEQNNIETRDMLPLTNQPIYKKLFGEDLEERYPVAKWINHNGFYMGCHNEMTQKELDYVVAKFEEFFGELK